MNPFKPRINVDGIRVKGWEAIRILREATELEKKRNPISGKRLIQINLSLLAYLIIAVALMIFLLQRYMFKLPSDWNMYLAIPFGLFSGAVFSGGIVLISKWGYRKQLRRAMFQLGYDLCANCGYWLKGLDYTINKCPECGEVREPMLEEISEVEK